MSVLLIGGAGALPEAIARRLLDQGDEVRVLDTAGATEGAAGVSGVHVARGDDLDADLVERACQNVRTVVVLDDEVSSLEIVVEGAGAARVERCVVVTRTSGREVQAILDASGMEYVVLRLPRRGLMRKSPSDESIAEAVDAADDVTGPVREVIDDVDSDAARAVLRLPERELRA